MTADELRRKAAANDALHAVGGDVMRRAADEIERLKSRVEELEKWRDMAKFLRNVGQPKPESWEAAMWDEVTGDVDAAIAREAK